MYSEISQPIIGEVNRKSNNKVNKLYCIFMALSFALILSEIYYAVTNANPII